MVMGVSLSPALGRWFRHAIPFAILTLLLLYISIWFFYEWPFPLPAQRTQQSGLRAGMRGVVQLPAALRGPEAESLGVGSGPPPAPVTA